MVNFDKIITRIAVLKGVAGDKHVAAILGLSPQDFSNRKKRGSLMPAIIEWAINETVNLEWLFRGDENNAVAEEQADYMGRNCRDKRVIILSEKLYRIIEEGNEKKIKAVEAQLDILDPGKG